MKPSAVLSELNIECAKCQEGLTKASQSNDELHRAMEVHIANLRILASPLNELQKLLPSVTDQQRCKIPCFICYCSTVVYFFWLRPECGHKLT